VVGWQIYGQICKTDADYAADSYRCVQGMVLWPSVSLFSVEQFTWTFLVFVSARNLGGCTKDCS
jgi:hypothetical protein